MRGFALVALCGCNSVLGLAQTDLQPSALRPDADPRSDLDRDGIKDVEDPCIAPETDGLVDSDGDQIMNGADPCPLDMNFPSDIDSDGILDGCDPYLAVAGDRLRCLNAFTDPDLNVAMWRPRDMASAAAWQLFIPRALKGTAGSIVADWPFEAPVTTTYDLYGAFNSNVGGTFNVFIRASPIPDAGDIGCTLDARSPTVWYLGVGHESGIGAIGFSAPTQYETFHMSLTFMPNGTQHDVRCMLRSGAVGTSIVRTVDLPPGYVGIDTTMDVTIYSIATYERDDAPAF